MGKPLKNEFTKPSLLMITGWAHGAESMQPLADQLASNFDVQILTSAEILINRQIQFC